MSRTILEIFNRYTPDDEAREILLSADADSIKLRADKGQRAVELIASFPNRIPKLTFYRIEEAVRQAYELNAVYIRPRYPSELFGQQCIPDLLIETNRQGIVAKGFFDRCSYRLSQNQLDIEIPFFKSGVDLIYDADTPKLMEKIISEALHLGLFLIQIDIFPQILMEIMLVIGILIISNMMLL